MGTPHVLEDRRWIYRAWSRYREPEEAGLGETPDVHSRINNALAAADTLSDLDQVCRAQSSNQKAENECAGFTFALAVTSVPRTLCTVWVRSTKLS